MRRSILRAAVLPAATALALLAGCGGSDDEDTTASEETSAAETSAAEQTGSDETGSPGTGSEQTATEGAGSEFCTQASTIQDRISGSATAGDPTDLPRVFRAAAEEIRSIEAPEELTPDWTALADGAERFASTLENIDLTDPNALATLQQELAPLEQELSQASSNVETYLAEECGLEVSTEETAPSS
ncbi:hypothetical protein [Blastococcus sp. VKM Ac-2987]|uniref:hypothetical protein n=1 Tax=Blastococcus sp. VKM Ac-2987 TaxID=3004141 RepID=UPI0022AB8B1E|nr:hypothetical protein [Blastococcus sp. VKM Ac-2987]MCZ2859163.1 hypothetical protein [Blastococcus sp. VKM Ac-2987]